MKTFWISLKEQYTGKYKLTVTGNDAKVIATYYITKSGTPKAELITTKWDNKHNTPVVDTVTKVNLLNELVRIIEEN